MNREFKFNQKRVYNKFKQMEQDLTDDVTPVYKNIPEKQRRIRERGRCSKVLGWYMGERRFRQPTSAWIDEVEQVFMEIIPIIDTNPIPIDDKVIHKCIKKKKNWSAPGPESSTFGGNT